MQKFYATFGDGHTQVIDNGQFYPFKDYLPLTFRDFNQRVYIVSVRDIPGQDSTWIGSELTAIEGIPVKQYLEKNIFPFISASTVQHLWMQAMYRLVSDFKDHPFRGTIKKVDGTIENIVIQHNGEDTRTDKDRYWGPNYKYSSEIIELNWLADNTAHVSVNRFDPEDEAIRAFDRIAPELKTAKAVIIDLRSNGGGSTTVAWHLQKYLTKGKYFLNYAWETRINDGVGKANGNWKDEYKDFFLNKAIRFESPDTVWVSDTLQRITCPVVILIGRYTFSAAEDFLVNLFEVPGRPMLIGEETGGSTGSPLLVPGLPGGGYARICTRRICYPVSMRRFINCGIKPDVIVKPTIDDYLQGKDVVLERAILELNK